MVDSRFFKIKGPFSLGDLATLSDVQLVRGDAQRLFYGVATLQDATSQEVALFHNPKYKNALGETKAGALILSPEAAQDAPAYVALLVSPHPLKHFTRLLHLFYDEQETSSEIHPQASVHPTAQLGSGCSVGPYATIEAGAVLEKNCWVGAHAHIGKGVMVGEGTSIGNHVTLTHAIVGKKVLIKPGARIGQRGFGFFMEDTAGLHETQLQLGRVIIEDFVEIGANTTIDRGSLKDTLIEAYARIDNLVQIAHNVRVGRGAVLVAQVGIAGSTTLGERSVLAGQVGVAGHLSIGAGVRIAAKSGVMHSLAEGETFGGIPAVPIQEWRRQSVLLRKMSRKGTVKN